MDLAGERMVIIDTSKMAFVFTVGYDGVADMQAGDGIDKQQAARWLRDVAGTLDPPDDLPWNRQLARFSQMLDEGIHRTTVMDHLERNNVKRRGGRKLTDAQAQEATNLYQAGNSLTTLGKRYHVDPQTVSSELKKLGVQIRPPGR